MTTLYANVEPYFPLLALALSLVSLSVAIVSLRRTSLYQRFDYAERLEILDELPEVEVVAVPVGGGGLSSGIAIAIKEQKPEVDVYGVEAETAASLHASLMEGKITTVQNLDTVCDGIAVKTVGAIPYKIAQDLFTAAVTVEELQVTKTLFYLLERAKIVVEPAGCVALSAFQHGVIDIKGKKNGL